MGGQRDRTLKLQSPFWYLLLGITSKCAAESEGRCGTFHKAEGWAQRVPSKMASAQ